MVNYQNCEKLFYKVLDMQKTPRIVNLQRHESWEKTTVALT